MPRLSPTLKTAFALAAVLAAPLLILYFINQYAVNVPYIDEWSFTRVIYAYRQKQLTFGMFLEPHNGHVIAFPRLAMLGLAVIARRWNIIAELYANVVLCLTCVFAWWAILRPHTRPSVAAGAAILCSWLIFSLIHALNWFMGFQITWVMAFACGVFAIIALNAGGRMAFAAACALAFVGSFSMGGGLLIWVIGFGMLLFLRRGKRLIVWSALAALSVALFLRFTNGGQSMAGLGSIPKIAEFVAVMLGAPFGVSWGVTTSQGIGMAGLAAFALLLFVVMRSGLARPAWMPWAAFGALAILQATLTAVGRVEKSGSRIALSSHYALFGLLFWVGLVGLFALWFNLRTRASAFKKPLWLMAFPLAALFAFGYIQSSLRGYGDLVFMNSRAVLAQTYILADATSIPTDVLQNVHWSVDLARVNIAQLRQVNESVFGTANAQAAALKVLQAAQHSADAAAAIGDTSTSLPAARIAVFENAPGATVSADGALNFQRVIGQVPVFDVDVAPLTSGAMPAYLVVEARRAGVMDIYPDTGQGFSEKTGAENMQPAQTGAFGARFAAPIPPGARRVRVALHYLAGSPQDEAVRFVLVERR